MTSQRTRDRLVHRLQEKGITNTDILEVMRRLPRHLFVDEALAQRSYEDSSLPIGHGQTISQPFIVARMTEVLLEKGVPDKVLEVGTGSGYQAALLSYLVPRVYTVERIEALQNQARERFSLLGINNVYTRHSDGSWGWEANAPYPAIMVTAAPREVPQGLLEQLAVGGVMVIPVGQRNGMQTLLKITRTATEYLQEELDAVRFVPLIDGALT